MTTDGDEDGSIISNDDEDDGIADDSENDGGGRTGGQVSPAFDPPPSEAALPGLASAPREAALEDRGFALGPAEFWAAAAAAAKVARFCNCRALIPGGEEPERVLSNLGTTSGPHPNWC